MILYNLLVKLNHKWSALVHSFSSSIYSEETPMQLRVKVIVDKVDWKYTHMCIDVQFYMFSTRFVVDLSI